MGNNKGWIKDTVIQLFFIVLAVVLTVTVAYTSLSDQYTQYFESKLLEKAQRLSYGTSILLSEKSLADTPESKSALDLAFSDAAHTDMEDIQYTLFAADGQRVIATNREGLSGAVPEGAFECFQWRYSAVRRSGENQTATVDGDHTQSAAGNEISAPFGSYTNIDGPAIDAYYPVITGGNLQGVMLVSASYAPFLEYEAGVRRSMYASLFQGCLIMVILYAAFAIYDNAARRKRPSLQPEAAPKDKAEFIALLKIQLLAIAVFIALSLPFWGAYSALSGALKTGALLFALLLLAMAAAHILRLFYWLLLWYLNKPVSSYSSQTLQFLIFLIVFIAVFAFSVQNSYLARIELSRRAELRQSSLLAAAALGPAGNDHQALREKTESLYTWEASSQCVIIAKTQDGYALSGSNERLPSGGRLFDGAWDEKMSVTGVSGGYMYGVTPILDSRYEVTALLGFRQPYSLYEDELRRGTIDFLLGMAAAVVAFVILFVELNKLLEALNIRGLRIGHPSLKFAKGTRGLIFIASLCQAVPIFFFVLTVQSFYNRAPIPWLPVELAKMLPLGVALLVTRFGKDIVKRFYKPSPRAFIMTGCVVGAVGFLALSAANNFFLYMALLAITYTGISMVYRGLWSYAGYALDFADRYPELALVTQNATVGDYTGCTAGAALGAMVYDKFGLFAALALAAAFFLILCALIRLMLPQKGYYTDASEEATGGEARGSLLRFLKSKNVLSYSVLILIPISAIPYFIYQFSPLYAESIQLSPGAVSWTSLLQVLCIAYVTPPIFRLLIVKFSKSAIAAMSIALSAVALFAFAALPGILTLFMASAIIGIALGLGEDAAANGFEDLKVAEAYKGGQAAYYWSTLAGVEIGTVLFTIAHTMSAKGKLIYPIAALILLCSLAYAAFKRKKRKV